MSQSPAAAEMQVWMTTHGKKVDHKVLQFFPQVLQQGVVNQLVLS